jgi:hypothetical protein
LAALRLGQFSHLGFRHAPQREAQKIELIIGGGEQKIGLIAGRIMRPVQLCAILAHDPPYIMAGGKAVSA